VPGTGAATSMMTTEGDDGVCHILERGSELMTLCGTPPRLGGRGIHVTAAPTAPNCDGCGRPRCQPCVAVYERGW
jgi:hypothetical protein